MRKKTMILSSFPIINAFFLQEFAPAKSRDYFWVEKKVE